MKIAVTLGVYNEEKNIQGLLDALLHQSYMPDEIIIVDDGSTDQSAHIIKAYGKEHPLVHYIYQNNAGPAAARNKAWRNSQADICIFTDGDCVPESNWIEELTSPFSDNSIGATAGVYKTLNRDKILARVIGLEIDWRYRNVEKEIEAHGTYNLAVRKKVLQEIGGFNEAYTKPSGEDWDLTYKISKKYKILYIPSAIVGHYHPEKIWPYMQNQMRRAYDRIRLYKDHPEKKKGDNYTPGIIKYQILSAGLFMPSLIFLFPLFRWSFLIPLTLISYQIITIVPSFLYFLKKDASVALWSVPIQIIRNYFWFIGLLKGILKFGL
jgi:glycosyltransferase involved in cell wall biosynthesis